MAETLEATTRALFKSWFVDFDPVRAKAEGRPTDLPADLVPFFPYRFGDDGLPDGWRDCALGTLVHSERASLEPSSLGERVVDHFSLPAFDTDKRPKTECASAIKSMKLCLTPPILLFSKLNPETPRVWPVLVETGRPMLASTEFLVFSPVGSVAGLPFLDSLLRSESFRKKAEGLVTGTSKSHQRVQPASLLATKWVVPPPQILNAFDDLVLPMMQRTEWSQNENTTLAALRDTLLPRLISGELRIRDAERVVAAA